MLIFPRAGYPWRNRGQRRNFQLKIRRKNPSTRRPPAAQILTRSNFEVQTWLALTPRTSPSGYPWISGSQVRSPTTSPRVGLYITKPGRWIYFRLTPPTLVLPDLPPVHACMRRTYGERKESSSSARSRCSTETRSFSLSRISRGCFKSRTESNLLPPRPTPFSGRWLKCPVSALSLSLSSRFDAGAT